MFLGFFALYQLSFTFRTITFPGPNGWFWADSYVDSYKWLGHEGQASRHPLFALVAPHLYELGQVAYRAIDGHLGRNLTTAFPSALLGGLNVCLAFWLFLLNHPNRRAALGFSLLYGFSTSTWFYSSLPESYVMTAFWTNLFLLSLVKLGRANPGTARLALLNGLASLCAPHQILLAVVPGFYWLRTRRWKTVLTNTAVYSLGLIAAFVIPYVLFLELFGAGFRFPDRFIRSYASVVHLIDPDAYVIPIVNFLIFSVVGPVMHPMMYHASHPGFDHSFSTVVASVPATWLIVAVPYLLLAGRSLLGLRRSPARLAALLPGISALIVSNIIFFAYFNPFEVFLYSMPLVLPWLLVLHSGFLRSMDSKWAGALLLLVVVTAVNSSLMVRFLRQLYLSGDHPLNYF